MRTSDFEQLANNYGFARVGEIVLKGALPSFQLAHTSKEEGWVYLWLEVSDSNCTVVYVGMTEQTYKTRFKTGHEGGFKPKPQGSSTGRAHAERLRQGIAAGRRYDVYARKSDLGTFHDEPDISLASLEEIAFQRKFQPAWDKEGLRRARLMPV